MSIRQINQSHRYSNVKYIVKSHNMFGIYHRMRFRCALKVRRAKEMVSVSFFSADAFDLQKYERKMSLPNFPEEIFAHFANNHYLSSINGKQIAPLK